MYTTIARWYILPGNEQVVSKALQNLAAQVKETEPGTLAYVVNLSNPQNFNLPTPPAGEVVFFEVYKDRDAFMAHLNGTAFNTFVNDYGNLFLSAKMLPAGATPEPFMLVESVDYLAGFMS